ncbi:acetamidase/formamidase family protein, partial [Methylobacterium tarhaniae]|uniref:acetamidase/formamidase family protein n=1 Tax=Methylobacterium tarhaniae TaxID=1187852 RepID=UPI003CFC402A
MPSTFAQRNLNAIVSGGRPLRPSWKKFGYSGAQAYSILGTAPVQGHVSGVVDVPNACATLWLPTGIFEFDINPSASGPVQYLDGSIQMPISPDK